MPKKHNAAWSHNRLIGNSVMMQKQAQKIDASPTASGRAKTLARSIYHMAQQLEAALREERK